MTKNYFNVHRTFLKVYSKLSKDVCADVPDGVKLLDRAAQYEGTSEITTNSSPMRKGFGTI